MPLFFPTIISMTWKNQTTMSANRSIVEQKNWKKSMEKSHVHETSISIFVKWFFCGKPICFEELENPICLHLQVFLESGMVLFNPFWPLLDLILDHFWPLLETATSYPKLVWSPFILTLGQIPIKMQNAIEDKNQNINHPGLHLSPSSQH